MPVRPWHSFAATLRLPVTAATGHGDGPGRSQWFKLQTVTALTRSRRTQLVLHGPLAVHWQCTGSERHSDSDLETPSRGYESKMDSSEKASGDESNANEAGNLNSGLPRPLAGPVNLNVSKSRRSNATRLPVYWH